ncbi:MAG: ATP-dependent DNA helicase RecG [Coriobacteriia bacterium]|nr:ATP-dependent DNA helicase RecG [Coriobacteriia bacterium]
MSKMHLQKEAVQILRTASLYQNSTAARYVSSSRANLLQKLSITTVKDLLWHIPFRYLDFTKLSTIAQANIGEEVSIYGEIYKLEHKKPRPKLDIVELTLVDETGTLLITFFKQPWLFEQFREGMKLVASGRLSFSYGFKRLNNPFFEIIDEFSQGENRVMMLPIHKSTEGISLAWIRRIISSALEDFSQLRDHIPAQIRVKRKLMSYQRALRAIHFPSSNDQIQKARERLAYDEILSLLLALKLRRSHVNDQVQAFSHTLEGSFSRALSAAMPFELTQDQREATSRILAEMHEPLPMSHMLLGDVGTGKTAVASLCFGPVADSLSQAAMMAPTSVLAEQYARKIGPILNEARISWALLTGASSQDERKRILAALKQGSLTVLFGTHALLEDDVEFRALSLVIIDEQHRFGVNQRSKLRNKNPGADLLLMSATPIPRTLALSVYGDISTSYLKTRPNPGAGVSTSILRSQDRGIAYDAIKNELKEGRQAYIICPLVGVKPSPDDASEIEDIAYNRKENPKAAAQEAEFLQKKVFTEYNVGLLTGKMRPAEKRAIMDDFNQKKIDVLVSTTVVEVGIDVPNASIMMIEDAHRFGLAQLHQLRGRIGRGDKAGHVYLMTRDVSEKALQRLSVLERYSDGFTLAEMDLSMRKEGELMGTRQSGDPALKVVDFVNDKHLINQAYQDAHAILSEDKNLVLPKHRGLRQHIIDEYGNVFIEVTG